MFFACGATFLFSCSVILARRSSAHLGPWHSFALRTLLASLILFPLAHFLGAGFSGPALGWFILSGLIGFGLSDLALFRSLDHLGSRLSLLMVQCLAAPFAVLIEWLWLRTLPSPAALAFGALILLGVGLALAPAGPASTLSHLPWKGLAWGILAAAGQGAGAVLSRHGFATAALAGTPLDALSSTAQRMLGGLTFVLLLALLLRRLPLPAPHAFRCGGLWALGNALAGPVLGVACYQAALRDHPSGLVLPIVATAPLVVIPMAWWWENDRPSPRTLAGTILAAVGVAALVTL